MFVPFQPFSPLFMPVSKEAIWESKYLAENIVILKITTTTKNSLGRIKEEQTGNREK